MGAISLSNQINEQPKCKTITPKKSFGSARILIWGELCPVFIARRLLSNSTSKNNNGKGKFWIQPKCKYSKNHSKSIFVRLAVQCTKWCCCNGDLEIGILQFQENMSLSLSNSVVLFILLVNSRKNNKKRENFGIDPSSELQKFWHYAFIEHVEQWI